MSMHASMHPYIHAYIHSWVYTYQTKHLASRHPSIHPSIHPWVYSYQTKHLAFVSEPSTPALMPFSNWWQAVPLSCQLMTLWHIQKVERPVPLSSSAGPGGRWCMESHLPSNGVWEAIVTREEARATRWPILRHVSMLHNLVSTRRGCQHNTECSKVGRWIVPGEWIHMNYQRSINFNLCCWLDSLDVPLQDTHTNHWRLGMTSRKSA